MRVSKLQIRKCNESDFISIAMSLVNMKKQKNLFVSIFLQSKNYHFKLINRDDHSDVETGLIHANGKNKWATCVIDNVFFITIFHSIDIY